MKSFFKKLGLLICAFVVILFVLRLTPVWDTLLSGGQHTAFSFETQPLEAKENHFLLCPEAYCTGDVPHAVAPIFDIPADQMIEKIVEMAVSQPDTMLISSAGMDITFMARTSLVRWPDWVDVRVIPVGESQSTLAIYSSSVYGRKDFGANQARVEQWLSLLQS